MRNKLLLLLLLLLPAWVAWAQAPVWQNVSGITGTATTVRGSALAANGDYYIVGSYTGSADFGNGKSLTSSDQTTTDGFLARISGTTNLCTWAVSMGGTSGADEVRGVAVNGSTVYITGYYNSSASFFNTSNTGSQSLTAVVNPTTGTGSVDVFVAKYDENGNPLGSISGGGTSSDQGYSIAVNGTSIYITGFITTSTSTSTNVKFGTVTLGNSGSQDMFVARFTDNGTLAHGGALSGGGTGLDRGNAIGVGTNGIYVAGYLTGTSATIGGTALTGAGSNDLYVAKFTDSGSGLNNGGAVRSGGANSDQATALTVSGTSIYVGGFFNQNATAAGSVGISGSTLSSDNRDLFLAKYTDSGSGLSSGYAIRDGSGNVESVNDLALSGSTVYVVGGYTTAATIAGSNLTSNGDDAYVAKYTDTGTTFSAIGAIDGGASAGGAASTGVSTVSVSGNQVVLGGFLGSPATFAPAVTGTITVPANNSGFFARLAQAPVLTSISPNAGPVGTSVTLTGTNLTGATVVTFSGTSNNTVASVTVNGTGTQTITVNIPTGATTGNVTVTTPAGTSNGVVFTVQQPTTVTSIVRASSNPTNATTVNYTVTFGAPVTGLTAGNFTLTTTGSVSGASVGTPVSTGTGSTWTVPVTTGTGSGTLTLNLANATNLSPGISTTLPFAGETYTIDRTAPTVVISSSAGASGSTTGTTPIPFTLTFSESVTGLQTSEVSVTGGTLSGFSGSGTTYTFNVTPSGSGSTVTVNVAANQAQDAAGNGNTAAAQFSITYQQPSVTVASVTRQTLSPTATTQVSYRVVFSGSVLNLTTSNFTATVTSGTISGAAVTSVSGSGTTYTVVVNTGTGDGTLRLDVANSTNTSPTISNVPYTAGEQYTITKSFAAAPTLRIQAAGSASGNSDVTAFVDLVQVRTTGTGTPLVNGVSNISFETNNVASSNYLYQSQGVVASPWSFGVQAGVSRNGSAFGSTASNGDAVAFLQSIPGNSGSITQNLAVPTGSYQVTFDAMQRNYTSLDQRLNVFVNDVFIGNIQPNSSPTYDTFTSAAFNVTAPSLTATVSTTSTSPTSTSPIPFSVSFSQSVNSTFTASDVTVSGGTLNAANFSGSGAGPYTFTVTPSGVGTVSVSLNANVAIDANNTSNTASNTVSVQFVAPTIVIAPASLPNGTQGTAYSQALSASGGSGTYTYAITAGALPAGLTLTNSTIAGTPTTNGSFTFTVTATDNSAAPGPYSGARSYTLTINPQPVTAAPVVTTPANGSFSNVRSVTAAGTAPAGSTVSVYIGSNLAGTTPASAAGVFSYVIPGNAPDGTYTVSATAQSSGAATSASSNVNTFTIDGTAPTVALSSATVASGSSTSTSPVSFTATFNEPVLNFTSSGITVTNGTVTSGPTAGSGNTYTFQVTPSTAGNVTVTVPANAAKDRAGNNNTASSQYAFTFQAPTIVVGPASLPNGTQAAAYSQTLTASGGTAPYTFAITAGALPAGLTLTSAGTLAGTPTANGSFNFTVTATDASAAPGPYSGSRAYTLTIGSQPVTAAPVVIVPANGSFVSTLTPTYGGTAPAGSTIQVYVDGVVLANTTTANSAGNWAITQPAALAQGSHTVYATAQSSGSAVSANSNTNTFTVDSVRPSVAISSTTGTSGSTTTTSPFAFTVTFSESVTGFVAGDLSVSNGTVSGFSGSGSTYTFTVTPTTATVATTVNVAANVAQDQAGNGNTAAASAYSLTLQAPTIVVVPATLPNGTQGTAYSQTLTASGGTAPYAFAITAGALPAGLTLTSAGTLAGTPTANGSFNFTVTATDASAAPGPYSGSRAYTLTIAAPAVTSVSWNGNTNTDWFNASNWTPNQVPDATINAVIPTSPSGGRFPFITSNTVIAQVRNLTINSGATLTQTNNSLVLAANLTNNGTFQATGGTVLLGNTSQSNIVGASTTRFWNLTVGPNGALLATSAGASMQRILVLNGPFSTNGNSFTLESNASNTAMVVNNGSNVVNGTVTVQRYITPDLNPNLGYRHVSAPISNATVGSLTTASFTPVVNPAYNTSATPTTVRPFPTVYGYNQSRLATATNDLPAFDKGWFSPAALSDAMTVGQGYTVNTNAGQTWNFVGTMNNGNVSQTLSRNTGATTDDSGLQLVGNPYPSPLDWQAVSATDRPNVDGIIYVWTSNDPTNPYAGNYTFFNGGIGNVSPVLPLGQAFFVKVTAGQTSGTLNLNNNHRVTSYTNPTYHRTAAETRPLVQLTLKGAGNVVTDDAFVYFEAGATDGFDKGFDGEKLANPSGLNLSTSLSAKQRLCINGLEPLGASQKVVPLAVGVPATGSYTLNAAQLLNLDATPVYLRDLQLGTVTDLRLTPSYQFTVTNASTLITNRFELVFSPQKALATVPTALAQQVALYPNPAKKAAFVELPASLGRQAVTASLVDALGRQVRTVTLPAQGALAHQLDLSELATGVYALRLATSAGVVVKKLVIE